MDTGAGALSPEQLRALRADPFIQSRLLEAAEAAKIALSAQRECTVSLPLIVGGYSFKAVLTQKRCVRVRACVGCVVCVCVPVCVGGGQGGRRGQGEGLLFVSCPHAHSPARLHIFTIIYIQSKF